MFGVWDPNNLFDTKGVEPPPLTERIALGTRILAFLFALLLWGYLNRLSGLLSATLAACGLLLIIVAAVDIAIHWPRILNSVRKRYWPGVALLFSMLFAGIALAAVGLSQ